jgi:hypothetical protein
MKDNYQAARDNLVQQLESLADQTLRLAMRARDVPTLDSLDRSMSALYEKFHAISYVLGAASAIKCLGAENSQFTAPDDYDDDECNII